MSVLLVGMLVMMAGGLLVAAVPVFGNKALIVRSGSMQPAINVGDLAVVRPGSGTGFVYKPGDVIAWRGEGGVIVMHRVIDVKEKGQSLFYVTKGDANSEPDAAEVLSKDVIGRKILGVPYLGKLLALGKTRIGLLAFIVIPSGLVIWGDVWSIVSEVRKGAKKRSVVRVGLGSSEFEQEIGDEEVAPDLIRKRAPVRVRIDSVAVKMLLLVMSVSMIIPSGLSMYVDSEVSNNNVLAAAGDYDGGGGVIVIEPSPSESPSPWPSGSPSGSPSPSSSESPSPLPSPTPSELPSPSSEPEIIGSVVINEVMWMGTIGEGGGTLDEWLELRNMTDEEVDLAGWEIVNDGSGSGGSIDLVGSIGANGYWLLSRWETTQSLVSDSIVADQVNSGVSFLNGGEPLILRDDGGVVVDQTPDDTWPAGENGSEEKRSMVREDVPGDGVVPDNWRTCVDSAGNDDIYWDEEGNNYGTPRAGNL
jgi:signal peptidase